MEKSIDTKKASKQVQSSKLYMLGLTFRKNKPLGKPGGCKI